MTLLSGRQVQAQTDYFWDGNTNGLGQSWNIAANWLGDVAPISSVNSNLIFDRLSTGTGTLVSPAFVNGDRTVGSIIFDNANGALPAVLNVGTNFTSSTTTARTLTINNGITLRNTSSQVAFTGGTATANGVLSIVLSANNTFTTSAGSYLQINSGVVVSGGFGLTLAGSGGVGLNAPNTFTGGVTVGSGSTLRIGASNQGNSASSTVSGGILTSGQAGTGTLTLQDGATLISGGAGARTLQNSLQMNGNVTIGATSGFTGGITFNSSTGSNAGETLTTPATIVMTADTTLTNHVATSFSNVVSGPANLTVTGSGPLVLAGANTYSGGLTVTNGATVRAGASSGVSGGSIVTSPFGTGTLTLQSGATLTPAGTINRTFQNNVTLGGNVTLGATSTFTGSLTFNSTSLMTPATINLSAPATLTVNSEVSFFNSVGGTFGLTKQGPGSLTLSSSNGNSYTGGTVIGSGTLQIGLSGALGTGPVTLGAAGGGDAALLNYLAGYSFSNPITVAADSGGTLTLGLTSNSQFSSAFTGAITLNDNLTVRSDSAEGFNLRLGGSITGSNRITKIGPGTLALTNANTNFSGEVLISAGTLQIGVTTINTGTTGGLGSANVVNNSALRVLRSNSYTLGNAISGTGSLTQAGTGTTRLTSTSNTYTGPTIVSAGTLEIAGSLSGTTSVSLTGGTLLLSGNSEAINDSAVLAMSAGTRLAFSAAVSNRTETLDSLQLLGNAILDFGTGTGNRLFFTDGITGLNDFTISIHHWSDTPASPDVLALGTSLSAVELGNVRFFSDAGTTFLGSGAEIGFGSPAYQIVPVPEPSSTALLGAGSLLGLIGFREQRRRNRRVCSAR